MILLLKKVTSNQEYNTFFETVRYLCKCVFGDEALNSKVGVSAQNLSLNLNYLADFEKK